jgi:putative ABC transport system permease protein
MIDDFRYAARMLVRDPGRSAIALVSLALGIGVNVTIFSVLNVLIWKPPPIHEIGRAVFISYSRPGQSDVPVSFPAYERYRDDNTVFSGLAAFTGERPLLLADGARRDQVYAEVVTPNYFSTIAVPARIGRAFDATDRLENEQFVVMLSDAFWRRRFASDPDIIGRTLILNGQPFTAIGVEPPGFTGLSPGISTDVWVPLATWAAIVGESARLTNTGEHWLNVIGRLKPGVQLPSAQTEMALIGRRIRDDEAGSSTNVTRAARGLGGAESLDVLAVAAPVLAVGLIILALACANITNLLLARAAARQRELAVRLALGGSRLRLIRLWTIEGLLLCSLGAGVGVVIAQWTMPLLGAFPLPTWIGQPASATLAIDFQVDWRVVAFSAGLAMLTGLLVGVPPALQASRADLISLLAPSRFMTSSLRGRVHVRHVLIVSQMAASLILLVLSGLFIRSALAAADVDLGFNADRVLLLPISENQGGVRVVKPAGFEQQIIDRTAALPGVEAATVFDPVPLWFGGNFAMFAIENGQSRGEPQRIGFARIAPRYFQVLQIPLIRGRDFTPRDSAQAPRVAIVNETLAQRFWPEQDALGKHLRHGQESIEIVGVARTAKYLSLSETAAPWIYVPLSQDPSTNPALSLAIRTIGDPTALAPAIEREVRAILPSWPLFQFRTLSEGLQLQRSLPRMVAAVLGVFGVFGLLLAALGVYGVMSLVVTQRTREIGIRMAVGAQWQKVIALVVSQGMSLFAIGAAIGIAIAAVASQFLRSFLVRISPLDPLAYLGMTSLLAVAAFAACYLPARRAARIDPVVALRNE